MAFADLKDTVAEELKGIERYNPENAILFEDYVHAQSEGGRDTYDLEANLALLKLYQFNPDLLKTDVVALVFQKSIMALPDSDFLLCKYLVDFKLFDSEPLKSISDWHSTLDSADFPRFWSKLAADRRVVTPVPQLEEAVLDYIAYVVGLTFRTIRASELCTYLGFDPKANERDAAALDALVAKHKWRELPPEEAGEAATPAPGERWYFIAPLEELVRSKNIKEPLTLDSMAAVFKSVAQLPR